jgi:alkylation response protein AidB-like acyl-CoA dehydrogenase
VCERGAGICDKHRQRMITQFEGSGLVDRACDPKTKHYLDVVEGLSDELEGLADEVERTEEFPARAYGLLADNDLLRLTLPEEWGGRGMSLLGYFPVLQRVANIHGTFRMFVHGQNGMWRLVEQWGTPEQKREWLPVFARGGLFTFGLTEPDAGTGRDIATTAVRDGEGWVINGRKHLISWAGEAELVHLIARTGEERGREATCFLLGKGTAGVRVERLGHTMGCKGGSHDRLVFEDCRLPGDAVLGEVGQGLMLGLRGFLDVSRLSIAVSCLGLARRAMDLATAFAKQRVTFGKPIAARQAVRLSVGEMAADIYAVQSAVDHASALFDAGRPITAEAAMCKYLGLEMVGRVTDRALRLHGGIGYTSEHKIERHYRDARALWFEEGTSEIQRLVIADEILRNGVTF